MFLMLSAFNSGALEVKVNKIPDLLMKEKNTGQGMLILGWDKTCLL